MDEIEKEAIIALAVKRIRENDEFAALVAKKVVGMWAQEIGMSFIKKVSWLIGIIVIALLFWLATKGMIKMPDIAIH